MEQGSFQLAALFSTICISILGGLLTGLILRQDVFVMDDNELYRDDGYWEIEQGSDDEGVVKSKEVELTEKI